MSTDPTIMAQAIADRLIEILSASRELDAVRAFVRGGTPVTGLAIDLHPFCEVWLASEDTDGELTGAIDELTYLGAVSFVLQMTDRIEPHADRLYHLASYDEIKRLAYLAIRELQDRRWHDLDGLTTQDEVVTAFYLAGAREYGIEPSSRRDNFNQTAVIPFVVEANRTARLTMEPPPPPPGPPNGLAVLLFADGRISCRTLAFPVLFARGMLGTSLVPVSLLDDGRKHMTTAQVEQLIAAGWDVCSHPAGDPRLLSDYDLDVELHTSHDWIVAHGCPLGARLYGPAGGQCDQRVLDMAWINPAIPGDPGYYNMVLAGFVVNAWSRGFPTGYEYSGIGCAETTGWPAIRDVIDAALGDPMHVIQLNFHEIVASDPVHLETSLALLTRIADYLDENNVQVVTYSQIYDDTVPS